MKEIVKFCCRSSFRNHLALAMALLLPAGCSGSLRDSGSTAAPRNEFDSAEYRAYIQQTDPEPPLCRSAGAASQPPARNVIRVLGIDALGWRVLNIFLAQGLLPNFQRLICAGSAAILHTDIALSPVSWTTIATGKSRDKHGIVVKGESESAFDYTSEAIRVNRVWDMMRYYNLDARVNRYYFVPTDLQGYRLIEDQVQDYMNGAAERFDCYISIITNVDNDQHHGLTAYLLRETPWGKQFSISEAYRLTIDKKADFLIKDFKMVDAMIGEILDRYPQDTLIIVSDHGAHARPSRFGITLDFKMVELRDLLDHESGNFNREIGLQMVAQNWVTISMDSSSYVLAKNRESGEQLRIEVELPRISINKQDPPDENRDNMIKRFLSGLMYMDTKLLTVDAKGDFVLDASFRDAFFHEANIPGLKFTGYFASHDSSDPGVLIAYGPTIRPATVAGPFELADVAPTLLYLAGLPVGCDMDGTVAAGIIDERFLADHPIAWVESYDNLLPVKAKPGARKQLSDAEIMHYRQLGYPGIR